MSRIRFKPSVLERFFFLELSFWRNYIDYPGLLAQHPGSHGECLRGLPRVVFASGGAESGGFGVGPFRGKKAVKQKRFCGVKIKLTDKAK